MLCVSDLCVFSSGCCLSLVFSPKTKGNGVKWGGMGGEGVGGGGWSQ